MDVLLPLIILVARIVETTMETIRLVYVTKGHKYLASGIGTLKIGRGCPGPALPAQPVFFNNLAERIVRILLKEARAGIPAGSAAHARQTIDAHFHDKPSSRYPGVFLDLCCRIENSLFTSSAESPNTTKSIFRSSIGNSYDISSANPFRSRATRFGNSFF